VPQRVAPQRMTLAAIYFLRAALVRGESRFGREFRSGLCFVNGVVDADLAIDVIVAVIWLNVLLAAVRW